jgi:hypothetical protein
MEVANTLAYYDMETIVTLKKKDVKFVMDQYYKIFTLVIVAVLY